MSLQHRFRGISTYERLITINYDGGLGLLTFGLSKHLFILKLKKLDNLRVDVNRGILNFSEEKKKGINIS